jgi:hypothetical protein
MARSFFLRGLAVIYFIAFASLLPQITGLIGPDGILPAGHSNAFLLAIAWAGIACSLLLLAGILPLPAVIALYLLYLSIDTMGQEFFSFQWDALLLETGFAAILLAPWGIRPSYSTPIPRLALWAFRFLIFRLMFESGIVKLLSGDPTWRDLTALKYHYETQPLPTPIAWYAAQLPLIVQKISVAGVFLTELLVPFLFFATRRLRMIAACLTIALQLMIAFTGNYTFFNLLTILLCTFLFDIKVAERPPVAVSIGAVLLIVFGVLQLATMFAGFSELPQSLAWLEFQAGKFQVVNRYGLFAVMTTSRSEIVIEGSDDGIEWKQYEFKYKPGDLQHRLPWVAPYQPRLDWQMWFAALSNFQENPWFSRLILRLLEGRPEVARLLAANPFSGRAPRFIRAVTYDYHFTDWATRRKTGAIWTRTFLGEYFPAVSLR